MDDARLRNREGDDPEEDAANVRLRKQVVSVICGITLTCRANSRVLTVEVQVDLSKRSCRSALRLEFDLSDWRGAVVLATWRTRNQIGF